MVAHLRFGLSFGQNWDSVPVRVGTESAGMVCSLVSGQVPDRPDPR